MVWHIFGKDLKLLWRMVVGVGPAQLDASGDSVECRPVWVRRRVPTGGALRYVGDCQSSGNRVLIVMVVQQDPIPGLLKTGCEGPSGEETYC